MIVLASPTGHVRNDHNAHGRGAYGSAQGFLETANVDTPGCILLDVRMPGLTGLQLQQRLAEMLRDEAPARAAVARRGAGRAAVALAIHFILLGLREMGLLRY